MASSWGSFTDSKVKSNQEGDLLIPNSPSDGISCIAMNGSLNTPTSVLTVGSWDSTLSVYEMQNTNNNLTNVVPQSQLKHDAPILCSAIAVDGVTSYSSGCDGIIKMWNVTQPASSAQNIGRHDAPVRCMSFVAEMNVLITGSWDKTLRVWDSRSPNAVAQMQLSDRVYAMDSKRGVLVTGTADKQVQVFDLSKGLQKIADFKSQLSFQTRSISIFSDGAGFVMGCIEGRAAVEYFSEISKKSTPKTKQDPNFMFKCHREKKSDKDPSATIYSVNAISFHQMNTFCTGGSDGIICFWDKDAKTRLHSLEKFKNVNSISTLAFNPMGNYLLYAVSYDWSRGAEGNNPSLVNSLYVHPVQESEVKPKDKSKVR